MKRTYRARTAATVLVACLSLAASGCGESGKSDDNVIRIGGLLALTGPAAAYGARQNVAVKAAIKEVNANGGVDGAQIEYIVKDTKSLPTEAARAANQLMLDSNVIAIIGTSTSSETLSFIESAVRRKVPVIASNGAVSLTDPKEKFSKWLFRNAVKGDASLPSIYDRIVADGHKRVAVLYQEDDFGEQGLAAFQAKAKQDGKISIVETSSTPLDAADLTPQLTKLKRAEPDAILNYTSVPQLAGSAYRFASQIGIDVPIYGSDSIASKSTIEAADGQMKNMVAPAVTNPDDPSSLPKLTKLMKSSGGVTGFGELYGANGVAIVMAGLASGARNGEDLRDAIEKAGPIEGYGRVPMEFTADNHDGWNTGMFFWVTVENNKFVNIGE